MPLKQWLAALRPEAPSIDWRERIRVVMGALLGIALTAWISHHRAPAVGAWMIATMGASAVLVFAVPNSPLAQPWSVLGGNLVSALAGMACGSLGLPVEAAAALAVASAIAAMLALRCLHPPGGGTALLMVLAGIHEPWFALHPVLLNSLVLVLAGIAYNHATRRPYPHLPAPAAPGAEQDLDAVLARYNQVLDIGRDELRALIEDSQLRGYQRRLAELRCGDIMSRELITVGHATPLDQAWRLFRQHRIKALPVVDANGEIAGIVTPADFMRAAELEPDAPFDERLRRLRDWTLRAGPPERVGHIMSRQVRVAQVDRHLAELIPMFGSTGHHHIPIVAQGRRLVGMITQSDVVAALSRSMPPAGPADGGPVPP
ncbi:HPP family protein [Pelomonas sp. SE-A7]|uniref:HPP family protein n=1 Tax=Pelomonas sp. SE-A7 TaxID=3054953 RepID=UPI00259C79EC|nr:HPP family protein [Pelomonas sp. SE-A7]MDM4767315.1 HPP family protein [Pelomonas sp. SE-A7]